MDTQQKSQQQLQQEYHEKMDQFQRETHHPWSFWPELLGWIHLVRAAMAHESPDSLRCTAADFKRVLVAPDAAATISLMDVGTILMALHRRTSDQLQHRIGIDVYLAMQEDVDIETGRWLALVAEKRQELRAELAEAMKQFMFTTEDEGDTVVSMAPAAPEIVPE